MCVCVTSDALLKVRVATSFLNQEWNFLARRDALDVSLRIMNVVVRISAAGVQSIVGRYAMREPTAVPNGFAKVCQQQGWPIEETWQRLSDLRRPWFEADNGAYMYFNIADGQWWIDEPGGAGVYVSRSDTPVPPIKGWKPLNGPTQLPVLSVEQEAKR